MKPIDARMESELQKMRELLKRAQAFAEAHKAIERAARRDSQLMGYEVKNG